MIKETYKLLGGDAVQLYDRLLGEGLCCGKVE